MVATQELPWDWSSQASTLKELNRFYSAVDPLWRFHLHFSRMRVPASLSKPRNLAFAALCLYLIISAAIADTLERSPLAKTISPYILALLISAWVQADAREKRRPLCYDYDSFTFFFWPILTPIYLFQTRGLGAFISILTFILLWIATLALAAFLNP
jgi:hypothetical protein